MGIPSPFPLCPFSTLLSQVPWSSKITSSSSVLVPQTVILTVTIAYKSPNSKNKERKPPGLGAIQLHRVWNSSNSDTTSCVGSSSETSERASQDVDRAGVE